jgi:hypothetical protein
VEESEGGGRVRGENPEEELVTHINGVGSYTDQRGSGDRCEGVMGHSGGGQR